MKTNIEYENRQILPRLTSSSVTHKLIYNTNNNLFSISDDSRNIFDTFKNQWRLKKSLSLAKEIVSSCILFNNRKFELLNDAISLIKKNKTYYNLNLDLAINLLKNNSSSYLDIERSETKLLDLYAQLHNLKKKLIKNPQNSLIWIDQGYIYTILGQIKKAEKCMDIALSLNIYNRFIVRSASRFYLHIGKFDKALYFLKKSPVLLRDPWLLSTEISVNEVIGRRSRVVKKAKQIISDNDILPYDKSELIGTLSTLEFANGNNKAAKKLMNLSLSYPNENILAQAQFINETYNADFNLRGMATPFQYEAKSWYSFYEEDYSDALTNAEFWFKFQPFSSKPAELYSYISSVFFNKDREAINVLNQALISSPEDTMLLNNLVFSLLKSDNIQEAERTFMKIKSIDSDYKKDPILLATEGMLKIKQGFIEHGSLLYEQAIRKFQSQNNSIGHTKVLYFFSKALEESDIYKSRKLRRESLEKAIKFGVKDIINLARKDVVV